MTDRGMAELERRWDVGEITYAEFLAAIGPEPDLRQYARVLTFGTLGVVVEDMACVGATLLAARFAPAWFTVVLASGLVGWMVARLIGEAEVIARHRREFREYHRPEPRP